MRCPRCGASVTASGACLSCMLTAPLPSVLVAGVLELGDELGQGGMGVVFKARHLKLDRDVAVKFLPAELAKRPDFKTRFDREARLLAKLNHPHIVAVYDYGEEDGQAFIVMEYVEGQRLSERLPLPAHEAYTIALDICDALEYAHEQGIVHRDIKPENILIDPKGRAKVADFGIARIAKDDVGGANPTMAGIVLGTPYYMAPEALAGDAPDVRMDVYSAGVVIYQMFTGTLPIGDFETLGGALDRVVRKALSAKPDKRYSTMKAFRDELRAARDGSNTGPSRASGDLEWPGRYLHERFEMIGLVGNGRSGSVWKVKDNADGVLKAQKLLRSPGRHNRVVVERLRTHFQLMNTQQSPHVVEYGDVFADGETTSFTMELLSGQSLKDVLLAKGRLSIAEVLSIARACLQAFAAAHEMGLVHEALTPADIILCTDGRVKILDFGVARVIASGGSPARALAVAGSRYVAPEILEGAAPDGRADVYALGVILYEALTGRLPFSDDGLADFLRRQQRAIVSPIRIFRPEMTPELEAVVFRMMRYHPTDRFPDAQSALAALENPLRVPTHVAEAVCASCGAARSRRVQICPHCGQDAATRAGDSVVILRRVPPTAAASASLAETLEHLGCVTARADDPDRSFRPYQILVKGVSGAFADELCQRGATHLLALEARRSNELEPTLLTYANISAPVLALSLGVPWVLTACGALGALLGGVQSAASLLILGGVASAFGVLFIARKRASLLLQSFARLAPQHEKARFATETTRNIQSMLRTTRNASVSGVVRQLVVVASDMPSARGGVDRGDTALDRQIRQALSLAAVADDLQKQQMQDERLWVELEALRAPTGSRSEDALRVMRGLEDKLLERAANERSYRVAIQQVLAIIGQMEISSMEVGGNLAL